MIPLEHKSHVIYHTINWMKAITNAYGAEEGMKLYETIVDTLDPTVKGEVFKAMLTGDGNNGITITGCHALTDKVAAIKEIRSWTGLGLKEAKDIMDNVMIGNPQSVSVSYHNQNKALAAFKNLGLFV